MNLNNLSLGNYIILQISYENGKSYMIKSVFFIQAPKNGLAKVEKPFSTFLLL